MVDIAPVKHPKQNFNEFFWSYYFSIWKEKILPNEKFLSLLGNLVNLWDKLKVFNASGLARVFFYRPCTPPLIVRHSLYQDISHADETVHLWFWKNNSKTPWNT